MDQSLKKILHKIWDKYQVYDEKLIRKFLTGFKELDSIELRNEFRNWFGGDDAVFNKVEEFLSKPKHARVGGYDFDYKPINWDINVSNNHDMWVELDSSVVDANGKVTLDGYDGNTYDIGEVIDGEEFHGEDNIPWEVDDEINDIIRLQLKDLLMKNFGIDLVYYNNLVYDDQAFDKSLRENISRIKEIMGIDNPRLIFNIQKLVDDGIIFVTDPGDGQGGVTKPSWEGDCSVITLDNLTSDELELNPWRIEAMNRPFPDCIPYVQDSQKKWDEEKYQQVINSIEIKGGDLDNYIL